MGIKLLSVQNMVSWSCFQLVKSAIPCVDLRRPSKPMAANIKVIDSEGVVKIYHRPIHVSELMLEFPKHLVCRSDSFYIGQKIPPLSEHDQLQLGHNYFLLPNHFFHSVLSFVTIASFFSPSNNTRFLHKAASCQRPFDFLRTPSGCLRIRVSDEFISRLLEQAAAGNIYAQQDSQSQPLTKICSTPQLAKDYSQLVRRRQWQPKLEPIRENQRRVLSSPFRMKKNKKKTNSSLSLSLSHSHSHSHSQPQTAGSAYPVQHLRSIQLAYKPKIRIKSRPLFNFY